MNGLILLVVVATGGLLLYPKLANAPLWRATITPLASIIGSGFLVLGPILNIGFGAAAPLVMAALCGIAYLFGSAIRFNIHCVADAAHRPAIVETIETFASAVLAFAFIISVAYYLNLFGAFGISLTALDDGYHARLLTTAVFVVILVVGWTRGFSALERLEQISVGIKLAIIAGLLFGLAVHFGQAARTGELALYPATLSGWPAITMVLGLIVTVQGFETSRYLGETYDEETRVRSMRLAQIVSTIIYITYIVLLAFAFAPGTLTAIIDLMEIVAPVLPVLLVATALSAQFSAAVADTSGSGGLIADISRNRVPPKLAYLVLVGTGVVLTWTADVFEIISYASRAFGAYYALQAGIAAFSAWLAGDLKRTALFVPLGLLGIIITVVGQPVE